MKLNGSASAYQAAKSYPVRVGSAGAVATLPSRTTCEGTAEPPLESNETARPIVQCAYSDFADVIVVAKLHWLPPEAAVNQPSK